MQAERPALAVWETSGIILEDNDVRAGIYGRHFDTSGLALGPDFKINTNDVDDIREDQPSAAALTDGTFMVAWANRENRIAGRVRVSARRVDANGLPMGDGVRGHRVHRLSGSSRRGAAPRRRLRRRLAGRYRDGLSSGIFGQRFDSAAGRVGSEFLVNDYTFGQQRFPALPPAADGSFLVTWAGILVGDEQIIARRFASAGEPLGTEFEVNPAGSSASSRTQSVAAEPQGGYLVVWMSGGSIGPFNIFVQRVGSPAPSSTGSSRSTASPRCSSAPSPRWPSTRPATSSWCGNRRARTAGPRDASIRGQRYRLVE